MSSKYRIVIKNSAKLDLKKLMQSNLKTQFESIINTLKEDPYAPTQSFKKLIPKHLGRYSRRVNVKHRVVYTIDEELKQVNIYSVWTHYE